MTQPLQHARHSGVAIEAGAWRPGTGRRRPVIDSSNTDRPVQRGRSPLPAWLACFDATPVARQVWQRLDGPEASPAAWGERLLADLGQGGARVLRDGIVHNS